MSLSVSGEVAGLAQGSAAGDFDMGVLEAVGAQMLKAKMFNPMMPVDFILFDFNPDTIKTTGQSFTAITSTSSQATGGQSGTRGPRWRGRAPVKLDFTMTFDDGDPSATEILLDVGLGQTCKQKVDLILNWMAPGPASLLGAAISMLAGATFTSEPPTIIFQWGPPKAGFFFPGKVKQCNASYTRFHSSGIPTRAKVTVQMEEVVSLATTLLTNPTSGGRPGRQSHMISDGESLQTVATAKYGRPGLWRQIAAANNIDDPLAVRPGRVVYLPGREEIGEM